jgi:arabinofuranosyltransferase
MQPKPDTRDYRRNAEAALLACAAICFALLARYHFGHVCDDAFIAFRYAEHVVAGLGPVWNPGERVEGFSSPLWLGLLVLGRWAGVGLPGWASLLGVGFALVAMVFVHRFALALSGHRLVAAAACLAASLLYPLYYWAPAGLETALYTALLTAAAWSLVTRHPWPFAVVAALVGVTRPEGPLFALALVGLAWLVHGRRALRPGLLVLALGPLAAWLVFRRAYYGEWLPNTYYAKATGSLWARMVAGTIYAFPGLLALAVTGAVMGWGGLRQRRSLAAAALAGLVVATAIGAGGDWMWHGRMLGPALPTLVALSVAGVAAAPARRRFVLVLACGLGWPALLTPPEPLARAFAFGRLPPLAYQEGTLVPASLAAAAFIAQHYPPDALLAVNHAGALPYALPNPVIDMTGLADRHIAHEVAGGLHQKYDAAYVLSRRPRLIVLNSRTRPGTAGRWYHAGYWAGETALVAQPEFGLHYRPVPRFWAWQWQPPAVGGYILLFERY